MSISIAAFSAAGRRRRSFLEEASLRVDTLHEKALVTQEHAMETLSAIARRSEQNHIAWGISQAFALRRPPHDR